MNFSCFFRQFPPSTTPFLYLPLPHLAAPPRFASGAANPFQSRLRRAYLPVCQGATKRKRLGHWLKQFRCKSICSGSIYSKFLERRSLFIGFLTQMVVGSKLFLGTFLGWEKIKLSYDLVFKKLEISLEDSSK